MRHRLYVYVILFLLSFSGLHAQNAKKPIRENIEWLDVWMPFTNDSLLPRILLIGNSITRGYYQEVQNTLAGKAYVARLTTSKSVGDPGLLQEIKLVMSYHRFDIVHFNNGLHGFGYTEQQFGSAFPAFVSEIRRNAPKAKLIWATITPMRIKGDIKLFDERTERIRARNNITLDYIQKQKDISINDLWALTIDHVDYFEGGDGTHPNASGYKALGQQVAKELMVLLAKQ